MFKNLLKRYGVLIDIDYKIYLILNKKLSAKLYIKESSVINHFKIFFPQ